MCLNYTFPLTLSRSAAVFSLCALTRSRDYYIQLSSSTLSNSNRCIVRFTTDGQQYIQRRTVENGNEVLRKSNVSKKILKYNVLYIQVLIEIFVFFYFFFDLKVDGNILRAINSVTVLNIIL